MFCPIKNTKLIFKSFVNPFLDIDLTFFDIPFSSCLFDVTFSSLLSKSVFFTKLAISFWLAKFPCAKLVVKCSDVNLLKS